MTDPQVRSKGQDESFGSDLATYQGRLMATARRLCWSASEAEDMVQQTLLKAWAHRASYAPGTNLGGWLRTILRNEICSEGRRQMRRPVRAFVPDVDDPICPPNQEWTIAVTELRRQLSHLVPRHVEALMMVGALGYDHDEAAAMAGCARGTMKSRVSRARVCLRQAADASLVEN